MSELKNSFKNKVLEKIDLSRDMPDEQIMEIIDEILISDNEYCSITLEEKCILRKEVFNSIRRLDILQELVEDKKITEIMVNGPYNIFIEEKGEIKRWNKQFESLKKLEDVVQQIVSKCNRIVNETSPIVDARLEDGSRVNIVLPPVSLDGPTITIRKFPETPITIERLIKIGSITEETAEFLEKLVKAKYNIFISGGTGSGKTTFLNVLSNFIPIDERIITIEDSAELQIRNIPNIVRLEVKNANVEGENEITIRSLIKSALRMRPDRIIVGEVRDSAAIDMLSALNTGHDGSLSTGHANSPEDMLGRLESLVLQGMDMPLVAVKKQIASAIDIIVHLGRIRDKSRRVIEITEVLEYINDEICTNTLYRFVEQQEREGVIIGTLEGNKEKLKNRLKLSKAGIEL